jgi:hypothetical protein
MKKNLVFFIMICMIGLFAISITQAYPQYRSTYQYYDSPRYTPPQVTHVVHPLSYWATNYDYSTTRSYYQYPTYSYATIPRMYSANYNDMRWRYSAYSMPAQFPTYTYGQMGYAYGRMGDAYGYRSNTAYYRMPMRGYSGY